jgi:hypothetical protein
MRTVILISLLAASITAANSQVTWTNPVPIANTNANDVHPAIANSQGWMFQGEEILAFSRNGKDICILRTTGNGASWSDTVKYITTDSADNDYPSLYHMGSGQPSTEIGMLVWQSRKNGNLDIYASKYGQLLWSAPQRITTSIEDDRYPDVTWMSNQYFLVWEQRGRIVFSEYDGLAWSAPQFVTPTGDTLNSLPQVGVVSISLNYQPFVIWERRKGADTTSALMYSYRNGTAWTNPDTLVYAGNNRRPRFFKYSGTRGVVWEKKFLNLTLCYSGEGSMFSGRFQLQNVSPWTSYPENQRNLSVNGFMIITASPHYAWHAVSAWEGQTMGLDSIEVGTGYSMSSTQKLSANDASANRNPDVSQGTVVASGVRIWVVWEANVSDKWQLYGSNTIIIIDDVGETTETPNNFRLEQNYPNPFNPATKISYQLPARSQVSLKVFDVLGREVAALVNEEKNAGTYSTVWNVRNAASGVYFYCLQAGSFTDTKKLILMK